jgi:hypothetical protein
VVHVELALGRIGDASRSRAVAIASIAHTEQEEDLPTVTEGVSHKTERVHESLRAIRKGVDVREDFVRSREAATEAASCSWMTHASAERRVLCYC